MNSNADSAAMDGGSQTELARVRCTNCRNYVEDEGDFCEHCGARVSGLEGYPHADAGVSALHGRSVAETAPAGDGDSRRGVNSAAYRRLRNTLGIFVVLVLVLVISVVFSISRTGSTEPAQQDATASGVGAAIPAPRSAQSSPSDMVYVPGGSFTMGNDSGDEYEKPSHRVTLRPFLVDIHEVTLADYRSFINATGRQPPSSWKDPGFLFGSERQPVTGVDWYDAAAYAAWAGKRLPTEEEWELAARGFDQRKYPWGSDWHSGMANAGDSTAGHVVDVGSHPEGQSPFGAIDMVGNAWEWTATDLSQYPGSQATLPTGARKVIRGGSWSLDNPPDWTTTFRGFAVPAGGKDYSKIGFRCARDVEITQSISPR